MLTKQQQGIFDRFEKTILKREMLLLPSDNRGIGKTTILNELAFTYQALGYRTFVLTPCQQEYFAEKYIPNNPMFYRGYFGCDAIVIIDEAKFNDIQEFLQYCKYRKTPVVGFVDYFTPEKYQIDYLKEFKKEYECQWIEPKPFEKY